MCIRKEDLEALAAKHAKSYDEMIMLGAQYGFGECYEMVRPLIFALGQLFETYDAGNYFEDLAGFSILGCVAGGEADFGGGDGPERLRKPRGEKSLVIDLVFPERKWKGRSEAQIKDELVTSVRLCFEQLIERAVRQKYMKDETLLRRDFEEAIERFYGPDGDALILRGKRQIEENRPKSPEGMR